MERPFFLGRLICIFLLATAVGCSRVSDRLSNIFDRVEQTKALSAETQVKMLRGALQSYRIDVGEYPSTSEGLTALMAPPPDAAYYWDGPYLMDEIPLDPWDTPYQYEYPSETSTGFALYSLGADGRTGGEGVDADIGYLPQ